MEIRLEAVGKRFVGRWIFKDLTHVVEQGAKIGITGYNGSGKSTLLRILTGAMPPSSGQVSFFLDGKEVKIDKVFSHLTFASPYTDLIEEMSIAECLAFHSSFRDMRDDVDLKKLLQVLGSQFNERALIKTFSSGMKQRLRLALAILSKTDAVVLDEPTSNLDVAGKEWYQQLLTELNDATTLIIASNEADDMRLCSEFVHIPDYLPSNSVSRRS